VVAEFDVWRAANHLIRAHGADAALVAAQQADALLDAGDIEGRRKFIAVVKAIGELVRDKLHEGERVN
jgi:hypothetical protein